MPADCVPTKDVIKHFDIDFDFFKSIVNVYLNNDDGALE